MNLKLAMLQHHGMPLQGAGIAVTCVASAQSPMCPDCIEEQRSSQRPFTARQNSDDPLLTQFVSYYKETCC